MTRKKSNVKALALAVTCAILAGGGIGLKPVYAADELTYDTSTNQLKNGATAIDTLTIGGVTIHGSGKSYGITIGDKSKYVMISDHDISATGYVSANIITSGINARMSDGNVIAKNGLYIGYDGFDPSKATYDNSKFAVKGSDGSFKAAGGNFTVSSGGAITADSLALTGTDGTINVGKDIKDNANNIKNVNGQVTNVKNDVSELKTTTGQLQTKVGELTATDTAARNDIIALQKKTAGITEYGGQITTNSLKLRESASSEEQEITAAKVKGYDKAVAAVGDTSTEGTLAYNTQKIKFKKDNKVMSVDATYIEGITHAGDVRLANGEVRAKSLVLEEDFADGTTGQATLTRESIVNLNGMTNGQTKIKVADGSEVGGVTFSQGKVTNVTSINDKLEFADDGIYLNKGDQAKQIKIGTDGKIIIGTSSSAYDTNGFYAGGDDYDAAKAGIKSDGSLKATGFTVDGATGNTTVGGTLTVAGEASFAKETAFGNGIKTDTISENNEGKGVTVDGVLLKDKGITAAGDNFTVNGLTGDVTTKGALKGKTLEIGTNGSEFTVNENGAVKAAGGKVEIDKDGNAQFGAVANNRTTIAGKLATFGENTTTDYTTINGGNLDTYNLTVRNDMNVNNFKAKNITSENRITVGEVGNGVYLDADGTLSLGTDANQKLGKTQLANINDTIKANKVIEANSATIGDVEIKGGNVTTTGTVQGNTIYDGVGAKLENGKITAKEGKIGNVVIKAGVVSGVTRIEAQAFKVDEGNYLDGNGITAKSITAKGGTIGGAVIDATTLTVGVTKLDSVEGITTHQLKIRDMTLTDKGLNTGDNEFEVNGVKLKQGQVTAMDDKGFVVGTSSFKKGSLIVDANNKLEANNGLTTQKATVTGTLDVIGQATFGAAGNQTTINGQNVTTDTLRANKLILGASGTTTVVVDKDGSLKAAGEKFEVDKDGALKAADGAFYVDKDGKTTFKKDDNNLSSINGGNILAKATDDAAHTSSELTHTYKGLHVSGTKAGKTSAFDFDAATGIGTFTGQDKTTTTINGSNLTLTNGANSTALTAGGATFTGAAGEKGGKVTTINGGTITTDTLNVERINLGGEVIDKGAAGVETNSKLYMDAQGNFRAAEGNFTVKGGTGTDRGALHNEVGKTSFDTTETGASMKFDNTAVTGGVTSEVTVEANKATVAAGDQASFVATTNDGGTATITGGTQTVTTTGNGTVFENSANKNAFVTGGATNTIINGNEITTGKITTDQLVITGQGNADGNGGSIAFGGDGTIKSDINDGQPNGKNTSFETTLDGVNTKVTNGTTTTENKVTAAGNSNTVTNKDATQKSEFNQGLTSIGGVVTNGTVKMSQELTADGVKFEQTGYDEVNIAKGDVTVKNNRNTATPNQEVHLSDLGSLNNLDGELTARSEYTSNQTAVGAINAEAGIRREEVARLDNRIDDVNNRVDKVGAMAAAIASLKSIGYDPQAPSEFSIGLGQYKGETGVAMGFFHYPNKNFMINVSLSTAGGETMGGIGATWRFGHKSPQKLLEEQREAQAKKELAAAEKYQAAAKLAKEAQERAEYAAKLARQAQVSADNAKAAADATQAKHFG